VQPPQSAALQRLGPAPEWSFETFDPSGRCRTDEQRDSLLAAFDAAVRFAADPSGWLVLQGPSGCGKTHLAAAVANSRARHTPAAVFVSVPDLLDHLRSTFAPDSPVTYDQLFDTIRTAPLLILDDLGTQSSTPWADEKLYQLLNYRYNAQLATVVTTNPPLEKLEPRLASRLADQNLSIVCAIDAPDYRWPDAPRSGVRERPPQFPKGSRR
jgi:DNA replication protein DnaC